MTARYGGGVLRLVPVVALLITAAACGASPSQVPVVRIDGPATVTTQPGATVRLSGSGTDPDGGTVALSWDLGDGTTAKDVATTEHSYPEAGAYRVVLTGQDTGGTTATPAEVIVQVGNVTTGGTNSAMRFGGTGSDDIDRVKIPVDDPSRARTYGADIGATDMTIELWLRARPGDNGARAASCGDADAWIYGNIVLDRDRYNQGRKFGLSIAAGHVVFGLTGAGSAVSLCSSTKVDDDRWHHVAVTRSVGEGTIGLYVDGRQEAQVSGPPGDVSYPDGAQPRAECDGAPCTRSDPYLVIGAEKHDVGPEFPAFRGLVDELRLSTTIRYPAVFTPPTRRFDVDPATAALYHFDEGSGPVVLDAVGGPGRSDGIVRLGANGPAWVPSDAPTGPSS